jgi:hypothetical protein
LPNFLEYCSFVFFSSGCLVGPFLEYKHFKDWIELNGAYENLPRGKKGGFATLYPALERLLHGFIFLILFITISGALGFSAS